MGLAYEFKSGFESTSNSYDITMKHRKRKLLNATVLLLIYCLNLMLLKIKLHISTIDNVL